MAARGGVVVNILSKYQGKGVTQAQKDINKLQKGVQKQQKGFSRAMSDMGISASALVGVGVGAWLVQGISKAAAAEASWATLGQVVDKSGKSFAGMRPEIEATVKSTSDYAAVARGDVRSALQGLIIATGDTDTSMKALNVTADLARAKNMDLAGAGQLVGRALAGNTKGLARYGIMLDKGATKEQVLAALEAKMGGVAGKWANTAQGRIAGLNNKLSALQTEIGQKALPAVVGMADGLSKALDAFGALPDPVKNATLVVVGFGAAAKASSLSILGPVGLGVALGLLIDKVGELEGRKGWVDQISIAAGNFWGGIKPVGDFTLALQGYHGQAIVVSAAEREQKRTTAELSAGIASHLPVLGDQARATSGVATAVDGVVAANGRWRSQELVMLGEKAGWIQARLNVKDAEKALADAIKTHGKNSDEARLAEVKLQAAQIEGKRAADEEAAYKARVAKRAREHRDAVGSTRQAILDLNKVPVVDKSPSKKSVDLWASLTASMESVGRSLGLINGTPVKTPSIGGAHGVGGSAMANIGSAARGLNTAFSEVGKPYVWGASGPNAFDCSGLVSYVLRAMGLDYGRFTTAGEQSLGWLPGPGKLVTIGLNPGKHTGINILGNDFEAKGKAYGVLGPGAARGLGAWQQLWHPPGFSTGGWGDFGRGTLAMLHGTEAIIRANSRSEARDIAKNGGRVGGVTFHFGDIHFAGDTTNADIRNAGTTLGNALTTVLRAQGVIA